MSRIISCFLLFGFMHLGTQAQWSLLTSPTSNQISDVCFISQDTGYAGATRGKIYKTIDGGSSWTSLSIGKTSNIFSVHFSDELNGNVCTGSSTSGNIYNTTDGGNTWKSTAYAPNYLIDIYFVNSQIGYCVGYDGKIFKTSDSGQNWDPQTSGTSENLRGIHFLDKDTGYVIAEKSVVLKTVNGGTTWIKNSINAGGTMLDIHFTDSETGFVVGLNGSLLKTKDGGITWYQYAHDVTDDYQAVHFVNAKVGYAVGGNGIISTTADGGQYWSTQFHGDFSGKYGWYSITSVDQLSYVVGFEGKVASTDCLPTSTIDKVTSCGPFTWVDGNTYHTITNNAVFTYKDLNGCDSIIGLDLTIPSFDLNTIIANNNITATEINATYQWIDCDDNNKAITGETNKTFTATKTGNYAVVLTKGNCSDTTNCVSVTVLGIDEVENQHNWSVYPNPSKGQVVVHLKNASSSSTIKVITAQGKVVQELTQISGDQVFDLPPGFYFIGVNTDGFETVKKVVVE